MIGGTLSSGHEKFKPGLELYASKRVPWQPAMDGAAQKDTMT